MSNGIRRLDDPPEALLDAARARLLEVASERAALDGRRVEIESQLERLRAEADHLEGLLAIHGHLPGTPGMPNAQKTPPSVADQVVALIRDAGSALHYEEIERRMRAKGLYSGGGQNPANTLLAKYFSDPRLFRPARGTYALREWQPAAASVGTKSSRRRNKRGA